MKLKKEDIIDLAKQFNLEEALIRTVLEIESSGSGFDSKTGLIKIQFEPHIFRRYTGINIINGVDIQSKEWIAYGVAFSRDPKAAMLSTSWGLGQIMGFNHVEAGYKLVSEMVLKFKESEYYQLKGMLSFIKSNTIMYNALINKDWNTFARRYNGAAYKQFGYDVKLKVTYDKFKNI